MGLEIRRVESKAERKRFIRVPWRVYQNDPRWVPPLMFDVDETLDPDKNPYFEHGQAALFIAEKHGEAVGRISAHTNSLYNDYHDDKAGFFGFFESVPERDVARSLVQTAEQWLADEGCDQMLGPMNFCTNQGDTGTLVRGFEHPPMIMCTYNPPYYPELLEAAGLEKAKDLFGWVYELGDVPAAPAQVAAAVEQYPGLRVRPVDADHMERDVRIVRDVFNAAWSRNWGYVPWTEAEVLHAAKMMKMILHPKITAIAEVDGEPAGMMLAFPNILEVTKDLNGRLAPFGLLKLIHRLKLGGHRFRGARLFLLGVKPEFRGSVLGGLSVLLYVVAHRGGLEYGMTHGELGWTLEDNEKINAGIQFMGGRNDKVYRVYGKSI